MRRLVFSAVILSCLFTTVSYAAVFAMRGPCADACDAAHNAAMEACKKMGEDSPGYKMCVANANKAHEMCLIPCIE